MSLAVWRRVGERHWFAIAGALLFVWGLICYGFVLRLPFFYDDLPIMRWVSLHGWDAIWWGTENGYYRPLVYSLYKGYLWLPLGARQFAAHGINLALHYSSSVLLLEFTRRISGSRVQGALAGALLLAFPFISGATPWVTALPHLLAMTLMLLAACAALWAMQDARRIWWGVTFLAAALAPLAHESGVAAAPIAAGVVLAQDWRTLRRWSVVGLLACLDMGVLFWRGLVPGVQSATGLAGLENPLGNAMYFFQGLLYPFGPLFGLAVRWGWHDFALLGVAAALFIAALGALAFYRPAARPWIVLGLGLWILGALPTALALPFAALYVGSRLYTLAAPGIVLLWAGLLLEIGCCFSSPRLRWLAVSGLAAGLLFSNFLFLRHIAELYRVLDDMYRQVLTVTDAAAGRPVGFVNLPGALIWRETVYPLVTDNAVFVPDAYTELADFVAANRGPQVVTAAVYGALFQETNPFWLTLGSWLEGASMRDFVIAHDANWLARYDVHSRRWRLWEVGAVTVGQPLPPTVAATFTDGPLLIDMLNGRATPEADVFAVTLSWVARDPLDASIFVHVRDATGTLITQADGAALGGILPLWAWRSGDRVRDVRYITLPEGAAGPFDVYVGVYNASGRLPAFASDGARLPDDAVFVGQIFP